MATAACAYHSDLPVKLCNALHNGGLKPTDKMSKQDGDRRQSLTVTITAAQSIVTLKDERWFPLLDYVTGCAAEVGFFKGLVVQITHREFKDPSSLAEIVAGTTATNFKNVSNEDQIKATRDITESVLKVIKELSPIGRS